MLNLFKGLLYVFLLIKTEKRKGEFLFLCMAMENTYSQLDFMLEKEVLDELKGQAGEVCRGEKDQCNREEQGDWHRALKYGTKNGEFNILIVFYSLSYILIEIQLCNCA